MLTSAEQLLISAPEIAVRATMAAEQRIIYGLCLLRIIYLLKNAPAKLVE
jgi:hypothetical protein